MSYYINPNDMPKEEFLNKFGTPTQMNLREFNYDISDCLPVCLINNGEFTAALIVDSIHEYHRTVGRPNDWRPKTFFLVKREYLEPYYDVFRS